MKRLIIVAITGAIGLSACATKEPSPKDQDKVISLASPKSLDDQWSQCLIGQWDITAKSDVGKYKNWVTGKGRRTIEIGLNGQFLIMKGQIEVASLSEEYIRSLKETSHATDQDIENIRKTIFEALEVYTLDPATGETIGYLFDSLRCVAVGRGKREANREMITWQWSAAGQGTSVSVMEKINNDTFAITETYTLPDGVIMVDTAEMTRVKAPMGK